MCMYICPSVPSPAIGCLQLPETDFALTKLRLEGEEPQKNEEEVYEFGTEVRTITLRLLYRIVEIPAQNICSNFQVVSNLSISNVSHFCRR